MKRTGVYNLVLCGHSNGEKDFAEMELIIDF